MDRSELKRKRADFSESQDYSGQTSSSSASEDFELHILEAIFELGLKHASPKMLINLMPEFDGLNSEHIKSHLQKYRIEWTRSKSEFMTCYGNDLYSRLTDWRAKQRSLASALKPATFPNDSVVCDAGDDLPPRRASSDLEVHVDSIERAVLLQKAVQLSEQWQQIYDSSVVEEKGHMFQLGGFKS